MSNLRKFKSADLPGVAHINLEAAGCRYLGKTPHVRGPAPLMVGLIIG